MGKIIDITGQRFGSLVAIKPTRDKNGYFSWECKCDCGNFIIVNSGNLRKGRTTSCGCLTKEKISNKITKNLIGKKFGKLTVIEKTNDRQQGAIVWKCICDCGKETFVSTGNLTSGHTKSCGCLNTSSKNIKDIKNQRFGKLFVKEFLRTENNESVWLCECDCGEKCEAIGWHLTRGLKTSCGCIRSLGETKIIELLKQANLPFEMEKTFDTCRFPDTNKLARFDFYVDNKYLIEYDGEQHFKGWGSNKNNLFYNQQHDLYKNQWCKENNIPLIRIPYTKLNTLCIEDLLLVKGE